MPWLPITVRSVGPAESLLLPPDGRHAVQIPRPACRVARTYGGAPKDSASPARGPRSSVACMTSRTSSYSLTAGTQSG